MPIPVIILGVKIIGGARRLRNVLMRLVISGGAIIHGRHSLNVEELRPGMPKTSSGSYKSRITSRRKSRGVPPRLVGECASC
mmetsp:Transcript_28024/g.52363  ORF Transcript_28024/g.52363 Transcript_28024/m.52363 type:complete len:82 (-) Transcript_28024:423-668(-)